MADERNFIEKAQFMARGRTGEEMSPGEMASEFSRWGIDDRVKYLDEIDRDLNGANLTVLQAARLHNYLGPLKSTHERLRKLDR
jgi:hypothetical protein